MNQPLVSIILPAYNAEKYIEESITSVIIQTYINWELLVADDGSTDKTKQIVLSFCKKDERIKYLYQPNGRLPKARNLGIANAHGEILAFIDADDVWFENKLEIQVALLTETKAQLIFSDAVVFTDNIQNPKMKMNSGKGLFYGESGLRSFLELNKIPVLTAIVKTELVKKLNGFTEDATIPQSEDYHLWLRLLMNGCVMFGSDKVLAGYREHPEAMSFNDKLCTAAVLEVLRDLKQQYHPQRKLLTRYQKLWFKRYHYSTNNWEKEKYIELIRKNCTYVEKKSLNFLFQLFYKYFGLPVTRKLINKFINNSFVL